jgi:hypothetical protein
MRGSTRTAFLVVPGMAVLLMTMAMVDTRLSAAPPVVSSIGSSGERDYRGEQDLRTTGGAVPAPANAFTAVQSAAGAEPSNFRAEPGFRPASSFGGP